MTVYKPKGQPPDKTCNALVRKTKALCDKPAGWKTLHLGYGRCVRHGGNKGQNANMLLPAPAKLYDLALKYYKDGDVFNLRKEISVAKAAIEHIEIDDDDPNMSIPSINMLLNTIGRLVQTLHEIEIGRKYVVKIDDVHQIVEKVLGFMMEYIPDAENRRAIAERMQKELKVPGVLELPPGDWRYVDEYLHTRPADEIAKKKKVEAPIVKEPIDHYLESGIHLPK